MSKKLCAEVDFNSLIDLDVDVVRSRLEDVGFVVVISESNTYNNDAVVLVVDDDDLVKEVIVGAGVDRCSCNCDKC